MLHPLEEHINRTIERLKLLRRSSPVVVALSGGADSVALLSVLSAIGFETIAAHCNFHLRGPESMRDMRHAEAIAEKLGVNIHVRDFNVGRRRKVTGESVEMACRELRYEWFGTLLDRNRAQAVAVAHHREDNVETFFLNLLRSSGIDGLTGMAWRRDYVVRPMLDVSRGEIESYLADKGLDYVTDSSNSSNDFKRNRLRNLIIPLLEKEFPGATDSILKVMANLSETRRLAEDAVEMWNERSQGGDDLINVSELIELTGREKARTIVFERLKSLGFNWSQTDSIIDSTVSRRSGRHFQAKTWVAELDRGILSLRPQFNIESKKSYQVRLDRDILTPVNIEVSFHNITEFLPDRDTSTVYFDEAILSGSPVFEIRHLRTGDRIKPFGAERPVLISHLMKNAHYSAEQKRSAWVLTRNDEIIWSIGLRASALFSLTPVTKSYIQLRFVN